MKIQNTTLLILFCFTSIQLICQKSKYDFYTDACACVGYFDSTKYTRTQIDNTFNYLVQNGKDVNTSGPAFNIDDEHSSRLQKLKKECKETLDFYNTLDVVNVPYWQKIKNDKIKYFESTCKLREVTILGYIHSDELLNYTLVDSTTEYYRNALIAGGDQMIEAWKHLNEIQKKNNGSPERVQSEFDKKYNSQFKFNYARNELMTYGWWNSANHLLPHLEVMNFMEQFKKLLSDVSCFSCDEP